MTPERWQQIERVFEQALALPEQERETFLNQACNGDEELRHEAESLLQSHDNADDLLEHPSLFLPDEALARRRFTLEPGQVIGRYRIVKEIGRGGMGQVYLAARADAQYEKHVALKLIKRGMDTEAVLRQFRNERQILASFDHPNIARLLDADTTEDGLSYFVMEYVEGVPIDKYCDSRNLGVTARLGLFRQVCAAVSYAHRHLVIHRDIKPSNILVSNEGVPKLLDFGIAKILQHGPEAVPTMTVTGLRLMTPEYASPEQVQGLTVTTVSDVYSLGVVLYKLLTGLAPYTFKSRSLVEVARVVSETIPQRPSLALRGAHSSETVRTETAGKQDQVFRTLEGGPERLRKRLGGDLDNIVLTALRKEPERRYQSVEQFSDDLRRHLAGLPVSARKDTLGYRGAKFISRNRFAAAAAALVFLFLVGGIIATTWQARKAQAHEAVARVEKARAERRFNEVRQLAHAVLFDYHDAIKDLPGATKVRERLVRDALSYLDVLSVEAGTDAALKRELAAAYDRVGDVRGQAYSANLGDTAGALDSYEKAIRIRESLVASDPHDIESKRELASSYRKVGNTLLETSEAGRGLENLRKSLALYVQLADTQPGDADIKYDLAAIYNDVGLASEDWGDIANALAHHRKALQIREQFMAADPGSRQHRRDLSVTYVNLGRALLLSGDIKGALDSNQEASLLRTSLASEDPKNSDYRRLLAISYQNDGDYRAILGDTIEALRSFRKKLVLDEQSLAADPANAQARSDFGYSCERLGELLVSTGAYSQALTYSRKSLTAWEQLLAGEMQSVYVQYRVIKAHGTLALAHAKLGDRKTALAESSEARRQLETIEDDPTKAQMRVLRAEALRDLGETYAVLAVAAGMTARERREHWQTARNMYQRSLDVWLDLRERGIINGVDAGKPDEIARELAKCDVALSK